MTIVPRQQPFKRDLAQITAGRADAKALGLVSTHVQWQLQNWVAAAKQDMRNVDPALLQEETMRDRVAHQHMCTHEPLTAAALKQQLQESIPDDAAHLWQSLFKHGVAVAQQFVSEDECHKLASLVERPYEDAGVFREDPESWSYLEERHCAGLNQQELNYYSFPAASYRMAQNPEFLRMHAYLYMALYTLEGLNSSCFTRWRYQPHPETYRFPRYSRLVEPLLFPNLPGALANERPKQPWEPHAPHLQVRPTHRCVFADSCHCRKLLSSPTRKHPAARSGIVFGTSKVVTTPSARITPCSRARPSGRVLGTRCRPWKNWGPTGERRPQASGPI